MARSGIRQQDEDDGGLLYMYDGKVKHMTWDNSMSHRNMTW